MGALAVTFRSLRVRNYRLFAAGQVVSLSGTWAQRVAQDWLVLELSGDSALALGVITALQFAPFLGFGLYGGVLADRYDKRLLLLGAHSAMGLLALVLAVLDLTGAVELWHVFVLAFALGLAAVVDTPVRQAFVTEMVGREELSNAVSLNAALFNVARTVGPAVGGLGVAALGTGAVFLANTVTYAAVLAGLLAMRTSELQRAPRLARARGQLREGLAYVRSDSLLRRTIALVAVVGTFGMTFQVTLALVTKHVFGRGAGAYGALSAALALGSLIGALASAQRAGPPRQRTLLLAAAVFGLLEIAIALAPTFEIMAVLLVPAGAAVLTFTTTANAIVQIGTAQHVRGRVLALYVLVFLGGTPLGALLIGGVAEVSGARLGLLLAGVITIAAAAVAVWRADQNRREVRSRDDRQGLIDVPGGP